MVFTDNQTVPAQGSRFYTEPAKTTKNQPERVGEDWPPLLTKKWLAIHFGCFNGREILRRRFRAQVLTPEVLQRAGISEEHAYSRSTRTFTATQSLMLTKILRGFCLAAFLLNTSISIAQTSETPTVKYSGDKFVLDTIHGQAMLTDSIIQMKQVGSAFQYQKVLSTIVVDAYLVKQYRFLVRAIDGGTEPFDLSQSFHLLTGGLIDPNRILIFKTQDK